jgi:pimeloyl-ACP methyl ester carboxylesterase
MIDRMYQARKPSRTEFVPVRHLNYHVRQWGQPDATQAPLVLVHGWMDVSASWQFVVDAMRGDRWIIAPDWRGFGLSKADGPAPDNYWFPDYLADLDILLDHYAGERAVDLVGHSMGGNVAMIYSGVRPQRIRRLVNLEGFGMPETRPAQAPGRYAQWIDEVKALHRGENGLKAYGSVDGVAQRLMKTNPRLPRDKADWLARQWAAPNAEGGWEILGDAAHKVVGDRQRRQPGPVVEGRLHPGPVPRAHPGRAPAAQRRGARRRAHDAPRPARSTGRPDRGFPPGPRLMYGLLQSQRGWRAYL